MFGQKFRHKVWVFMATTRQGLETTMPSTQAAREQQCRSQVIMPRLSGGDRWCTKFERCVSVAIRIAWLSGISTLTKSNVSRVRFPCKSVARFLKYQGFDARFNRVLS